MTLADSVRVLIVDDNRAIHEDFKKILLGPELDENLQALDAVLFGGGAAAAADPATVFRLDSAYQGAEALSLVQRSLAERAPYSVAFIDMRMPPGWDGLETIERIWSVDREIQVVICSAYSDHDWQDLIARLGRSDKLLVLKKPFERIEVLQCAHALAAKWRNERALHAHIGSLEKDVNERTQGLEAANKQLRHLATHDALTSLPNRVLLDDRVNQAIVHAERAGEGFALCVLDLDRFKLINDSLGHRAGDELLKQVARRLTGAVRSVDTVARLGGDEFVLIIRQVHSRQETEQLARKVLESLHTPVQVGELELHTSASLGIAFYPGDGTSIETLYAHADAAMYCSKQRGGANVECFTPTMNLATEERVRFEADLHRALKLEQFELHYQPKYDGATQRIHSVEALIRWRHPERGLVPPDQFIPLAEESGLIVPIGEWVLREACRQQRIWQSQGLPRLRVAVNISALQFRRLDLVDTVARALADAGIEARYLEIELTETAVMTDPEESVGILERLSRMGVIVSVDDFGTGYSSMSYLRRFPIDKLKIDRSFITNVMTSADDASIVQAIISLAHGLRLKVVAEGIESAEQVQFLRSLGCDQYQGFYFSRPVDAADFEKMLRQSAEGADGTASAERTHSRLAALPPAAGGQ
ncbi:MAG TPA: EAL domain-containing protein [Steroidobacteraceae bacterium]|jgi:diguanylate cyclase (GGDEF)-like protein